MEIRMKLLDAFTKPLISDRVLPPVPGTPPEAFEALYASRADPWGVLASPLADQRCLALVEAVGQFSPCRSIFDVGCGEGALTRYLVGCATEVAGIDVSATAIERARRLVAVVIRRFHGRVRYTDLLPVRPAF